MSIDPYLAKAFQRLDNWRHLPAYRLEPRADVFFAAFMDEILSKALGDPIREPIIPEFPLRRGMIYGDSEKAANASVKVDYLAVSSDGHRAYLVELKTDPLSRRPEQDDYLSVAIQQNARVLTEGVLAIVAATDEAYLPKYLHLLDRLRELGWIEMPQWSDSDLLRQDGSMHRDWLPKVQVSSATDGIGLSKVYIQPLPEPATRVISFAEVATIVGATGTSLGPVFAEHLIRWTTTAGSPVGPAEYK